MEIPNSPRVDCDESVTGTSGAARGAFLLVIDADPNAESFYRAPHAMTAVLKDLRTALLANPSIALAARWPALRVLRAMRRVNDIQLSAAELQMIAIALRRQAPCNFLVFGMGNDAAFWLRLNRGGNTVFLEDNETWLRKGVQLHSGIAAHLVSYGTRRAQWRELLDAPASSLAMKLPDSIERGRWDVILVDAPAGWDEATPGRMKSIFLASQLVVAGTDVFVHDCNRQVEQVYCDRFLKAEHLVAEVRWLRHYHFAKYP
jgi:uncharacterized protein (TIGR01627 family)